MRFKLKNKMSLNLGDKKSKVKFLLFPQVLNNELRWLEIVKIEYVYTSYMCSYDMGAVEDRRWVANKFLPYDPVYDCEVYKTTGCAHVDGYLCNMDTCDTINNSKTK